ncbi:MAG: hypothetical protein ACJ8FN_11885 [Sphingomicrobium sp.]
MPIQIMPPTPATMRRSSVKNPPMYRGLIIHTRVNTTKGSEPTM